MKYARALLRDVQPYTPGEQPRDGEVIKLNTNENPYPPPPAVLDAVRTVTPDMLRKYPDPVAVELRRACAERYGYPGEEWVIAGNGMDELLAMTIRAFCDPGGAVLTPYPTYILYETLAGLHGANTAFVDLTPDYQLPESFYETSAALCFLPRPNSPTGVCSSRADVERLCEGFDGLVIVDEAYVDFAEDDCMDFPRRFPNAMVMRTFSKSFGMAGLRLGVAVARPEIIQELMKMKDSYNLNAVTQRAGVAAMGAWDWMREKAEAVRATRARLTRELTNMGFHVPPSQANFLFAEWRGQPPAAALYQGLRAQGVLVRHFDARRLAHGLRITVGTEEETDALLEALRGVIT